MRYDFEERGFSLVCFDFFMYLGVTGEIELKPVDRPFGEHLFVAGKSEVVQIGDERGSAVWQMIKMMPGSSLLYLGVVNKDEKTEMLVFEMLDGGEPKKFNRNLFGEIAGMPYKHLYLAFHYLSPDELHISTRSVSARVFRPTLVFAENN